NGTSLGTLLREHGATTLGTLKALVQDGRVEVISGNWNNPHIKRLRAYPIDMQLEALGSEQHERICLFPTTKVIRRRLPRSQYRDRPFTRALALAHPQCEPVFFDLGVLERYQSDPRYVFLFGGLDGSISVTSAADRSRGITQGDKIVLQSFGLGRDARGQRVAAVFLRYLSMLSPRHQQHWQSHRLATKCWVDETYWRGLVLGEFTERVSVYDALLE